jgi:N-acetylglucosamine malate deacetylase 1
MAKEDKVLVIAAHPDDETIGMGGTIAYFASENIKVEVLFLSSGVGSRIIERQSPENRKNSAIEALAILGCNNVYFGNFPDNEFDSVTLLSIAKFIEGYIDELKPTTVYTNFFNDLNIDHQRTSEATQIAVRPKLSSSVEKLFYYETISSTGWKFGSRIFAPNYSVDVSQYIEKKIEALKSYNVELDDYPNARSLESITSLAKHRGSLMGFEFAESFEVGFIKIGV